jgi:hypothetical protein
MEIRYPREPIAMKTYSEDRHDFREAVHTELSLTLGRRGGHRLYLSQHFSGIPLWQDRIALGDVIQSARLILLDESNGIHPAKGSHQGFKSSRAQFDRLD